MKKITKLLFAASIISIVLTSCNKENNSQPVYSKPISLMNEPSAEARATDLSTSEDDYSAKCTTLIEGVGIAYIIQPIGAFGKILHLDITYYNTAPNGYLNIFLRQPGITPSTPVWQAQHVVPTLTGTGYNNIHYDITLLPSVPIPLELAIQGIPGAGGCRTTKNIFFIN